MGLFINTNTASINARANLDATTNRLGLNFKRLSTGLRITSASDDAAGLAISERMRARIRSLGQAQRNANDGISLIRVAEGAMNEVNTILIRLRELAIQANNGTVSGQDRDTLDQEFDNLVNEIDRIAQSTDFNGVNLLDGSTASLDFQVGAGAVSGVDTLAVTLPSILASNGLGLTPTIDISSAGGASPTVAISAIDTAIDVVAQARGDLGAVENRLSSTIANLATATENLSAAESRIRDVDVALETAELTRNTILQQAAITILAQANTQPQVALTLLG
jgi:flagellin